HPALKRALCVTTPWCCDSPEREAPDSSFGPPCCAQAPGGGAGGPRGKGEGTEATVGVQTKAHHRARTYSYFCPLQVAQKKGVSSLSSLDPEVLSVFVPPFISKEDAQVAGANCGTLSKTRRRSFRKKREKPKTEPGKGPPEDVSIPNGVDLLALPQLCFPGGVCVASEPKEDSVHFLVLTDVCGDRTYGVVAQYYRPLRDESCFYNGKMNWEPVRPSAGAAGCFVPFAVCVVSRFPYYTALKDCLSWAAGVRVAPVSPRHPPEADTHSQGRTCPVNTEAASAGEDLN
uniref:UDENN domain-containing protein n=1 Tax=Suricata suricatta TaxID=37032 RepID=A0A673VP42_SURSU